MYPAIGSVLAISDVPKEEINNLKRLEKEGMYGKFGFYESIDYTPERVEKGKKASIVKTYMAHHQGLILLSINNFVNQNILQKRFMENPEIEAVSILLQETMPETFVITKENKEKVEKLKYKDYEDYIVRTTSKIDERLILGNVLSSENYVIATNEKGEGYSKYNDIYINRFKKTNDKPQGIFITIKNIQNKKIWSTNYSNNNSDTNYQISFMPDKNKQELRNGNIKTKVETTIASNEPVEIRRITLENEGNNDELLEVTAYFEPVLSKKEQDYAHPTFNNLFLKFSYDEETKSIVTTRNTRSDLEEKIYVYTNLLTNSKQTSDLEYEINEEKFIGRGNLKAPEMIEKSMPFSKKTGLVTEGIIALKRTIKIKSKDKEVLDFVISANEDNKKAKENLKKYLSSENVKKEFELSKARVEAENRYLRVKGKEIEIYQKMMSYIIFDNSVKSTWVKNIKEDNYKQSELWKYGISGDFPIILVKIKDINDSYVIGEVLKAYEYLRTKKVYTELVIIDEEKYSYENYLKEEIEGNILNKQLGYLKNQKTGIFVLSKEEIERKDILTLEFVSSILIEAKNGGIENNIKEREEEYLEQNKKISEEETPNETNGDGAVLSQNMENLKYYNEYGGFREDGKEYIIRQNRENRIPTVWSHIMANEKFGTVVTENMGGYSWYKNSRLDRISAWTNDAVLDMPSEVIYIKDEETKNTWSLGLNPKPDNENYQVIYGFGYSKYIHKSMGINQELKIFVPKNDSSKIGILTLRNETPNKKKLKLYYYLKPVMGEDEINSNGYIKLDFDKNNNIIIAKNLYKNELENTKIYVSSSEKIESFTGDKNFFLGKGGMSNPDGIKKHELNKDDGLGKNICIAYQINIEIESFSEKEISIILGAEENKIDCKNIAYKYSKIQNCKQELEAVQNYWKELLGRLQVYTQLESTNILLNGWLVYQIIESRLIGRSGYYQSGGAFGFRDQLQDALGLKFLEPQILKNQILKHSRHQFYEGDVEHWWHEETKRGIRTRFSDDLLWLVYCVIEYIELTGDLSILYIEEPYVKGNLLEDGVDEKYDKYEETKEKEPILEHCIKAIEKSLKFGENGLPKMGSGDWNDGFSTVGNKGRGESVWLGFFLYDILNRFIPILEKTEDQEKIELAKKYEEVKIKLKKALNLKGWDRKMV